MGESVNKQAQWGKAITQGLSGHHPLFEPELVRFTMRQSSAPTLSTRSLRHLESVVSALSEVVDANEGRDWVAGAPLEVQELLVRAYFETLFDYLESQPMLVN